MLIIQFSYMKKYDKHFFDQNKNHVFIEQKDSKDGNRTEVFL